MSDLPPPFPQPLKSSVSPSIERLGQVIGTSWGWRKKMERIERVQEAQRVPRALTFFGFFFYDFCLLILLAGATDL